MPVTLRTGTYHTNTACRIRRGRSRDLCAETSGHGFFVMRDHRPHDGSWKDMGVTHWQQHSNSSSYKQVQGLSVGVNLQGLHGYESPDLLENRAEIDSCK